MEKGLPIFIAVVIIVAVLNIVTLRLMKIAEEKKARLRKVFWYFYATFFSLNGLINLITSELPVLISFFQMTLGIAILVLHFLGKIETKNPT